MPHTQSLIRKQANKYQAKKISQEQTNEKLLIYIIEGENKESNWST